MPGKVLSTVIMHQVGASLKKLLILQQN